MYKKQKNGKIEENVSSLAINRIEMRIRMSIEEHGVTVIHTGDLHLGFSYRGVGEIAGERQQDNLETFLYITSLCLERKIDILLIAGDLFDTPRPEGKLLKTVRDAFADIPDTLVIISPGNHDYYENGGIYDDIEAWSDNVYIFHGEMDCFEFNIRNEKVRIYGAAFTAQYQRESLIWQRRITRDISISIGIFHGEVGNRGTKSNYNRITTTQIEENRFDYAALGHVHRTEGILYAGQVPYAYCGCPEGHGFDETGVKGVYIGRITSEECELKFLRTCRREYIVEKICVDDYEGVKQLSAHLLTHFEEQYGEEYKEYLYQIRLYGIKRMEEDYRRLRSMLHCLYYVEIVDETVEGYAQVQQNTGTVSRDRKKDITPSGDTSLEARYREHIMRLIDMEETKEDRDEIKIKRYKRALELGLTAIHGHS